MARPSPASIGATLFTPTVGTLQSAASPREALGQLVERFRFRHHRVIGLASDLAGVGQALVFRCSPGRLLLVVGDGPLADHVRELIDEPAYPPWSLAAVPHSATELATIGERLDTAAYGALDRAGFTTIEEVSAAPDEGLAELRNLGPQRIATMRAEVPYRPPEPVAGSLPSPRRLVDSESSIEQLERVDQLLQQAQGALDEAAQLVAQLRTEGTEGTEGGAPVDT